MRSTTIRILHLSDLHLSPDRRWDSDPVLSGLDEPIRSFIDDGLQPDLVAITGDIAGYGKEQDYALATSFIREGLLPLLPRFSTDCLLIIAGNHDVDRSAVSFSTRAVQDKLLTGTQDDIAQVLSHASDTELLLRRHRAFTSFVNSFRSSPLTCPWWSLRQRLAGIDLGIAGLCSSWMSHQNAEQGDLLVGRYQLNQVFEPLRGCSLRVALIHHPQSFLREFDGEETWATLRANCDLILHGHLHKQATHHTRTPDDSCLECACGALYSGSTYANAFQLLEIDAAAARIRIHYRTWHDRHWIPDRNAYQAAANGVAEFFLRPQPLASSAILSPPQNPRPSYVRSTRVESKHCIQAGIFATRAALAVPDRNRSTLD